MVQDVRFQQGGRHFELRRARPAWCLGPAREAAETWPEDGFDRVDRGADIGSLWSPVPRWLRACDARRLRMLVDGLVPAPGLAPWQHEAQLHAAAERLLRQGRLHLYELTRRRVEDEQRVEQAVVSSITVTPSMLRPAKPDEATAAAPATTLPVIDQDRQAAVLRQAAALGTPFCEECARRRAAATTHPSAELEPA